MSRFPGVLVLVIVYAVAWFVSLFTGESSATDDEEPPTFI